MLFNYLFPPVAQHIKFGIVDADNITIGIEGMITARGMVIKIFDFCGVPLQRFLCLLAIANIATNAEKSGNVIFPIVQGGN